MTRVDAKTSHYVPIERQNGLPESKAIWRFVVFSDLLDLVGVEKSDSILEKFRIDLNGRFAASASRNVIRQDAHAIVSTAGLLGFLSLSEHARTLEGRCLSDSPFEEALGLVLKERDLVNQAIRSYDLASPPSNLTGVRVDGANRR